MSFFDGEVIAKEQLQGVVGAPTTIPAVLPTGGGYSIILEQMRRRKLKGLPNSLLIALREWLQFKVKEYD